VSGFTFQANQELDILFPVTTPPSYGTLSNGIAPSGFNVLLLQPNNPPGAPGDYSALALVNNPSLAGPFSVDFTFMGTPLMPLPGQQNFMIGTFGPNGFNTITSGVTTPQGSTGVPEPASLSLAALGVLMGGVCLAARRLRAS